MMTKSELAAQLLAELGFERKELCWIHPKTETRTEDLQPHWDEATHAAYCHLSRQSKTLGELFREYRSLACRRQHALPNDFHEAQKALAHRIEDVEARLQSGL